MTDKKPTAFLKWKKDHPFWNCESHRIGMDIKSKQVNYYVSMLDSRLNIQIHYAKLIIDWAKK